jgi:hypothetical protein
MSKVVQALEHKRLIVRATPRQARGASHHYSQSRAALNGVKDTTIGTTAVGQSTKHKPTTDKSANRCTEGRAQLASGGDGKLLFFGVGFGVTHAAVHSRCVSACATLTFNPQTCPLHRRIQAVLHSASASSGAACAAFQASADLICVCGRGTRSVPKPRQTRSHNLTPVAAWDDLTRERAV